MFNDIQNFVMKCNFAVSRGETHCSETDVKLNKNLSVVIIVFVKKPFF